MPDINFWAALAAAIVGFFAGGIWYAPPIFGRTWQREAGLTNAQLRSRSAAHVFGLGFVLSLLAALVFGLFLGPRPSPGFAIGAGLAAGLAWVTASLGINYLFEQKSLKLFLINGGYHTIQFTLYGAVFGLFH
jgi:hypothetical protein